MPNVLDIRRRIRSVRNTLQITKAMKMVSAARLRRSQERIVNARPYANRMLDMLNSIVARAEAFDPVTGEAAHPLLAVRGDERVEMVIITGDRGLCGAFNANIIKAAQQFLEEHRSKQMELNLVGRKGRDYFKKRKWTIRHEHIQLFSRLRFEHAREIAERMIEEYTEQKIDEVYLIYNEFKSVIQQRVVVERLLPIPALKARTRETHVEYIYEQPAKEIFDHLLPRHVETQIYRALLESAAAEHGARMAAMDAATNNAAEMIDTLTLNLNRVRQASITKEIIEIVSGANAL